MANGSVLIAENAIAAGIGMVHQHFMLVPNQTVTENILIGLDEPKFVLNLKKYDQKSKIWLTTGIQIDQPH